MSNFVGAARLRTAVIVGTGLIGTSVALALRARGVEVFLMDRDPEAAGTAASLGAGTKGPPSAPADLAVIAVPPSQLAQVLVEHQRRGLAHCFTDVASVKAGPQRQAEEAGGDLSRYVGGHPMAGRERSGPRAADGQLFEGRPWVVTPSEHSSPAALERVLELVRLCRADPVVMGHSRHDRSVALVSHLPHIVASLLAARLEQAEEHDLALVGQGLRDTVRIAGGDPGLWTDIIGANALAVRETLDRFAKDLDVVLDALRWLGEDDPERGRLDRGDLHDLLSRGVAGRARIPAAAVADDSQATDRRP
ncbi:prephenate dehydrogenase [Streptomyces sp. NPDC047000]|uniref:prephenate dehydrogenase n=1 Tax=Streptomyces sp. NPDC047000 TaxID=3155474 RepID=UPI0033FC26A0